MYWKGMNKTALFIYVFLGPFYPHFQYMSETSRTGKIILLITLYLDPCSFFVNKNIFV